MNEHHQQHTHNGEEHTHNHHHGSLKSYITGFLLAAILTAIPFYLVMHQVFDDPSVTVLTVLGLAAVQIVVHMVYFLHMSAQSEGGWTMLAFIFTLMLVFIVLSGSLWVMYHLDHNMMPGMMPE